MKLFLKGIIIGIGKIIPGVSGGFLAIILGVYEQALNKILNPFKKDNFKYLFILGSGILISILFGSNLILTLLNKYYLMIMLLFIGLIIGGTFELKQKVGEIKILSFLLGLILLFVTYFFKSNTANISFIGLFLVGIVEAATIIVPGVSGTAVLMILGYYYPLMNAISEISLWHNLINNFNLLWPFIIGVLIGFYLFTYLMNYLLETRYDNVYSFIMGISISSIILLFLETFKQTYLLSEIVIGLFLLIIGYKISKKCI